MRQSSKTLKNLPYFWSTKTCTVLYFIHFPMLTYTRAFIRENIKYCTKWKKKLKIHLGIPKKNDKFWSDLLEYFIQHKHLTFEECFAENQEVFKMCDHSAVVTHSLGSMHWPRRIVKNSSNHFAWKRFLFWHIILSLEH